MEGEELYVESEYSETVQNLLISTKHVPSNGTVVKIFTHPENDLDGEFYVHAR
jgi:hypothetical protein